MGGTPNIHRGGCGVCGGCGGGGDDGFGERKEVGLGLRAFAGRLESSQLEEKV